MNLLHEEDPQQDEAPELAYIQAEVDSLNMTAFVDGGSGASLVEEKTVQRLKRKHDNKNTTKLIGVTGRELKTKGNVKLPVYLGGQPIELDCIVVDETLPADLLIGKDAMQKHNIFDRNDHVLVKGRHVPLLSRAAEPVQALVLPAATLIPAGESSLIEVNMRDTILKNNNNPNYLVEGMLSGDNEVLPLTVTPMCQQAREGKLWVELTNQGDEVVELKESTLVAVATRISSNQVETNQTRVAATLRQVFKVEDKKKEESQELAEVLQDDPALAKMKRIGEVSTAGKARLAQILMRYRKRFAADDQFLQEPAKVRPLKVVPKSGAIPKFQRPYLLPQDKKSVTKEYLTGMRNHGVIQPSIGSWGSPLVLVSKKDGTKRVCVDLRYPNSQVVPHFTNLPNVEYVFGSQLDKHNSKVLSALDLSSFYHQVPLDDPEGILNISSHLGSFSWRRVPMGFVSSSAYVQSIMTTLLSDVIDESVIVLIDDLLLHTPDEESHLELLELVLHRLEDVNFVLKPGKCELLVDSVSYLGFQINGAEAKLHLQDQKVSKVRQWPRPKTVKEVRSFIAFCSYLRRFIPGFATLAKPLHTLTKLQEGSVREDWTPECDQSFQRLKAIITSAPTLHLPDPHRKFHLYCDASSVALGYVVMQMAEDGKGKKSLAPVAYGSRLISPTEARYTIAELEALAVSFALSKSRFMISGKDFCLYTDSDAVKASLQADANKRSKRLERFLITIQDVLPSSGKLEIRHVRGELNPSDPLSRTNFGPNDAFDKKHIEKVSEVQSIYAVLRSDQKADGRLKAIRAAQEKDVEIRRLRKQAMKHDIYQRGQRLTIRDGVVVALKEDGEGYRYLLPTKLAQELIHERHYDSKESHPSQGELVNYFSDRFMVPKLTELAKAVANSCDVCQRSRLSKRHFVADLTTIPRASEPMYFLSFDIAGPFLGYGSVERYVLVLIDHFSRFVWAKAVGRQTGKEVAAFLLQVFGRFGVPKHLLSDRGTNIRYGVVPAMLSALGVEKLESTAYHPASNGLVERVIGTIGRALKRLVLAEKDAGKWPELLEVAVNAYNRRKHSSTGYAPAEVLFSYVPETGREPVPARVPLTQPHRDFIDEKLQKRTEILAAVEEHLQETEQKRKETFDRTRARPHDFTAGQWVLVKVGPKTGGKLRVPYMGPARIDEVDKHTAAVTYISNGVRERLNIERLKNYYTSEPLAVQNFTAPKRQVGIRVPEEEEDDVQEGLTDDNVLEDPVVTFAQQGADPPEERVERVEPE